MQFNIPFYVVNLKLWEASQSGNIELMKKALQSRAEVEYKTNFMFYGRLNSLHIAAYHGQLLAVDWLLAKGANIDAVSSGQHWTALMLATMKRHYEVAKRLVNHGCDVNKQNVDGWSALHWAANNEDLAMCKLLVKNGHAIINLIDEDGRTPAVLARSQEVSNYLNKYV